MEFSPGTRQRLGGWSAKAVIIPMGIILSALLALIIVAIVRINASSSKLTAIIQDYSQYMETVSDLSSGASCLTETASEFVLLPTTNGGHASISPLLDYAQELRLDRGGSAILARFSRYPTASNVRQYVRLAAESADRMAQTQQHAIALIRSAYTVSSDPAIGNIPEYSLTREELDSTLEEKQQTAIELLFGEDYAREKRSVTVNTTAAVGILRTEMSKKVASASAEVASMRRLLWFATITILVVLVITFAILGSLLVAPLAGISRKINGDGTLSEARGLYEVRLLASAYNGLRDKRTALEATLRTAAETDPLTELPNRYRFDRCLTDSVRQSTRSVAIFSFDLNYLKHVNDTQGHAAGDRLLRSAARCISECFGGGEDRLCFRVGGDEFAAIVQGCTLEDVERMEAKFAREQLRFDVSIAVGRAFAEDASKINPRALMLEADQQMYARKSAMHLTRAKP